MSDEDDALLKRLREFREREDIGLPESPYFRKTYIHSSGEERPLELRGYQKQMVVNLLIMEQFVIGDDTGLGKTIEAIAALCMIWRKYPEKKAIVLTKKSSMSPGWDVQGFHAFTQGVQVILANGGPKQREQAHQEWAEAEGPVVLIQSYHSACNDIGRLKEYEGYILICDECTAFKNPKSRIHKVCKYLASRSERCWGVTATLIKNNLLEGYGIYKVVVPKLFPWTERGFMDNFAIVQMQRVAKGRQVAKIAGYTSRHVAKFRKRIEPFYLGRPKHAVADELPVLTTRDITVSPTRWQAAKYAEALTGLLEHGDGELRDYQETTKLTALIYCQEIVNHPALIEFPDYPSKKLDALTDLLTDGDLDGEKVIVFSRFKKMVDVAEAHLTGKGLKCVRVTGDESSKDRKEAMLSFQDPKSDVNVIFITMAGGDAINLQAAKALIFYDTPWSAGDYIQILGRMIRIGSEHDRVYAIHLLCRGTIDEHVQAVVKKKMKLIRDVLGERVKGDRGKEITYATSSDVSDVFDALVKDARKLPGQK